MTFDGVFSSSLLDASPDFFSIDLPKCEQGGGIPAGPCAGNPGGGERLMRNVLWDGE
jgi:hypothetical protein